MWQSAQATPERAWMPWFHISNSGCCALSVGAPVSACVQSFLAGLLGDRQVALADPYWLVKCLGGEIERMPEAIRSLRRVLAEEIRGRVVVVAGGDGPVRRLQPAVVLLVHDMAVGARGRVIRQVRRALRVNKSVA